MWTNPKRLLKDMNHNVTTLATVDFESCLHQIKDVSDLITKELGRSFCFLYSLIDNLEAITWISTENQKKKVAYYSLIQWYLRGFKKKKNLKDKPELPIGLPAGAADSGSLISTTTQSDIKNVLATDEACSKQHLTTFNKKNTHG